MTSEWAVAAIIVSAAALIAGALCIAMMRRLERRADERQRVLEEQVAAMDDALELVEARLTEIHSAWAAASQPIQTESEAAAAGDVVIGQGEEPAIEPEIQAAIVAAAIAAAGPNARVRSATLVKGRDKASPWSQQGRVLVQSSHNLRK
ncbi:hypothetical protein [Occallatibacter riparius]|uniref:Uncharacterized protein n=1 Tax=Occallatibacter riparius TaxID=1002689 RepID=A0A9J7BXD8_9BACT|nr:hypothetical protein [Occallatibacter riparius]UWZ85805.1 hypothetical protein MOP44_07620 [Occallatibacter riparius]